MTVWCDRKYCANAKYDPERDAHRCTVADGITLTEEEGCTNYEPYLTCADCIWFHERDEEPHTMLCMYSQEDTQPCKDFAWRVGKEAEKYYMEKLREREEERGEIEWRST